MYKDWQKTLIPPTETIIEVMRFIDKIALQIALVVDENNKVTGMITASDIMRRRA